LLWNYSQTSPAKQTNFVQLVMLDRFFPVLGTAYFFVTPLSSSSVNSSLTSGFNIRSIVFGSYQQEDVTFRFRRFSTFFDTIICDELALSIHIIQRT